jgi:hypothetical protein
MAQAKVDKKISEKSLPMIKAGGSGDGTGPTSSGRSYPKGSSVSTSTDFLPNKGKRSATTIFVGGV